MEHNFKKKFGQNFLSDKNLLSAIVSDAEICEEDNVLEIGAGGGALTIPLSQKAKKVVSYEIDKELESHLLSLNLKNTTFVFKDALKEDIKSIEEHFNGQSFKLVANLPYYITTPLLFKFLEESEKVNSLTIMVQKEVAERMIAKEGGKDYGVLSVMVGFFGNAKITRIVGRQMFFPQPNVDSAVVNIKRNPRFEKVDRKAFYSFVKTCFSMRRKTLANNLSQGLKLNKNILSEIFPNVDLNRRAESFSLEDLVEMFEMYHKGRVK